MLKANAILKEMSGINIPDEGIPSKAIWNPSGSLSSNSSVASTSSGSSTGMEEPTPAAAYASSTPAAFEAALPSNRSMETETSLRVYEDTGSEDGQADDQTDDDNRMSAMLMSSINTAHGSEDKLKLGKSDKKNDKLFGSTNDQRQSFVHSMENLTVQQLRIRLWDSFRLARVILGKPVKDKRKLSHKSILHAIRKVAEMKIQIIRLSEELERYRHREKKLRRLREKSTKTPGKENVEVQEAQKAIQMAIDGLSISSSLLSPEYSSDGVDGPGSIRDVISDSDSPDLATAKLREHAIKILEQESDLALSQLQEIDKRQRKRRRFDEATGNLLESSHPNSPPPIFLSPSESEDEMSYGTHESASDMLYAFRGQRSPIHQEQLLISTETIETEADEIRRVLQRVVELDNDQREPEITTEASSSSATSQVHQEVIALLTRLTQIAPESMISPLTATNLLESKKLPEKEPEALELTVTPVAKTEETKKVLAVKETSEEFPHDEMPLEVPDVEMDVEDEVEKEIAECQALNVIDEVEEDLAECRSKFAAAKQRVAESMEHHKHLSLQREMLEEDIAHAQKNTTQNREQVQLERLHRYKKELSKFLKREEERAKQLDALDAELDDLASHCVKLEDREAAFREKHEKHTNALKDFKNVNKMHTDKFRELMGSIDRGIKEQTETVFSPQKKRKGGNEINSLPSQGSESFDDDDEAEEMAQKVQRLEYNLTKKNMEIFRLKAKLMMQERRSNEGKPNEVTFVAREGNANEQINSNPKKGKKKGISAIFNR